MDDQLGFTGFFISEDESSPPSNSVVPRGHSPPQSPHPPPGGNWYATHDSGQCGGHHRDGNCTWRVVTVRRLSRAHKPHPCLGVRVSRVLTTPLMTPPRQAEGPPSPSPKRDKGCQVSQRDLGHPPPFSPPQDPHPLRRGGRRHFWLGSSLRSFPGSPKKFLSAVEKRIAKECADAMPTDADTDGL